MASDARNALNVFLFSLQREVCLTRRYFDNEQIDKLDASLECIESAVSKAEAELIIWRSEVAERERI